MKALIFLTLLVLPLCVNAECRGPLCNSPFNDSSDLIAEMQQRESQRKADALTEALTERIKQENFNNSPFGRAFQSKQPSNGAGAVIDAVAAEAMMQILENNRQGRKTRW